MKIEEYVQSLPKSKKEGACKAIAKFILKEVKQAESDIAKGCSSYEKEYEKRTGKPISTIEQMTKIATEFSKLPLSEKQKYIEQGKKEHIKFINSLSIRENIRKNIRENIREK